MCDHVHASSTRYCKCTLTNCAQFHCVIIQSTAFMNPNSLWVTSSAGGRLLYIQHVIVPFTACHVELGGMRCRCVMLAISACAYTVLTVDRTGSFPSCSSVLHSSVIYYNAMVYGILL